VSAITDVEPAMSDNGNRLGQFRGAAVKQDGPRSCPKAIFQRDLVG